MKDKEEGAGRLCPPWPWHPSRLTHAAQQQQTGVMRAQGRQGREMFVLKSLWKESLWMRQSVGRGALLSDSGF